MFLFNQINQQQIINESLFPAVINSWNAKVSGSPQKIRIGMPFRLSAKNHTEASVTVEATCIMPIMIMIFLFVIWILRLFYVYAGIESELYSIGNELVSYSYIYSNCFCEDSVDSSLMTELSSIGFNEIFVVNKIKKTAIASNVQHLSALLSDVSTTDEIDIVLTYYMSPIVSIPGVHGIWLTNHFFSRAYTGKIYESADSDNDDPIVYITPTGTVYHTSLLCSSIKVSITTTNTANISSQRNSSGAKYYYCEKCCNKNVSGTVYITPYGNRYHKSKNCQELKVSVIAVKLSEVKGRRKCRLCR